jgi:hypothetical protein
MNFILQNTADDDIYVEESYVDVCPYIKIKMDYKTSLAENGEFSFNKILCIYHNFI